MAAGLSSVMYKYMEICYQSPGLPPRSNFHNYHNVKPRTGELFIKHVSIMESLTVAERRGRALSFNNLAKFVEADRLLLLARFRKRL
jgi:hypothetical protein